MNETIWIWIVFNVIVVGLLALDLGVFHRNAHKVNVKEAATWTVVWISLALLFNAGLYFFVGQAHALEFFTAYLIEKALSVDNIFVFILIFSYFKVPAELQHRVLFWGVVGAIIMRAILIFIGATLISRFDWIFYFFGALLLVTSVKMLRSGENDNLNPDEAWVVRMFRRTMPVTEGYEGQRFFVRKSGVLYATPLFLVLLVIEMSDLVFAVDSIPAVFAISTDTLIVYTSNIFAILGLRSMYFLLSGVIDKFRYLSKGLAIILAFIGVKMIVMDIYPIPTVLSLGVIMGIIAISILLSIWANRREVPVS